MDDSSSLCTPTGAQDLTLFKTYTVAITGHRHFPDNQVSTFVAQSIHSLLSSLKSQYGSSLRAISALAEGADTIFAAQAHALGIPVEAVLAHANLADTFPPGASRQRYFALLSLCNQVVTLPFACPSADAYTALGHVIVEKCNLLIAVWDGLPPVDDGGTGGVVACARRLGRPVIHIHTRAQQIIS